MGASPTAFTDLLRRNITGFAAFFLRRNRRQQIARLVSVLKRPINKEIDLGDSDKKDAGKNEKKSEEQSSDQFSTASAIAGYSAVVS